MELYDDPGEPTKQVTQDVSTFAEGLAFLEAWGPYGRWATVDSVASGGWHLAVWLREG